MSQGCHQVSSEILLCFLKNFIRFPIGWFEHHHHPTDGKINSKRTSTQENPKEPVIANDETDILLPTRRIMIQGIEQDDIISKTVIFVRKIVN